MRGLAAAVVLAAAAAAAGAATREELLVVQDRLQAAAAPWCERLSERAADGTKRCTIKLAVADVPGLVNAMAAFGGAWITEAMLPHLSEDDLALVMSHEFAHLLLGHSLQRLRDRDPTDPQRRALLTWAERSNVPPHDDTPTDPIQQELDADELGLYLAGLAGYPVRELANFWALRAQHLPRSTLNALASGNSHPPREARAAGLARAVITFCQQLATNEPLMPRKAWLQPHYETDVELLREQQVRLSAASVCRPASAP